MRIAMTKLNPEDVDGIPVICEVCGTALEKDEMDEASEAAEKHNESRHEGDEVAVVVDEVYDVDTRKVKGSRGSDFLKSLLKLVR